MSCNTLIGENEFVYTNDMSVMAWGMSSVLAMLIVAEFFCRCICEWAPLQHPISWDNVLGRA